MNLHDTVILTAPTKADSPRPANRRTHHHVSIELRASQQRERCLTLRLEGRKLRDIAREVGISPSTVNGYIQQALRDSRAASAAMGEKIREQERTRLQAVIDRWQPVVTGRYRTKEAARAAEIVRKASERLRLLFGLPLTQSLLSEPVETAEPELEPEMKVLYVAFEDIALRMARFNLVPESSYDNAWDALEAWQPGKYQPANGVVQEYLRDHWKELLAITLD